MVSITISAVLPQLRPPPCPTQQNCKEATNTQLWFLYLSLLLTSLGTGGIKPCVVTFAADQFDMSKSKTEARGWNFFNFYYFCMGLATLIALTVVVYIQDNVGWGWGLGIPTIAMALSIVAFVIGAPLYKMVKPGGSPLIRLIQVIVAAWKKRNLVAPADPCLLYENKELDAAITTNGKLKHTNQFRWLDRAAVVTDDDRTEESDQPNLWRLAAVHRVEELKSIVRVLPIWGAGILLVTSHSHLGSFTIQQARSMDRHLSRSFTGNPAGITCLQRMGVGFTMNIFATIVSPLVEIKRKAVAGHYNLLDKPTAVIPISVFWLIPQYCLHGVAKVFMSIGHLEFLYDRSPESMRSSAVALYSFAISIGNYMGTLVVSLVHKYTGQERNWLPDRNLNRGRLENYYWLMTGILVVNLIYYATCAWYYKYKPLEESKESSDEIDLELAKDKNLEDHAKVNGEINRTYQE